MDRRIRKTKKALREGLVELLAEKSIQSITVRELCEKADIHRSTFYANFKDVYDLYAHTEDEIIREISDFFMTDYAFKPNEFFIVLLDYVNKNRKLSRLFFGGNISTAFYERLTGLFKKSCIECWSEEYDVSEVSGEMDFCVQFVLSGSLGAIAKWVSDDFQYPPEKLAAILTEMESNCILQTWKRKRKNLH